MPNWQVHTPPDGGNSCRKMEAPEGQTRGKDRQGNMATPRTAGCTGLVSPRAGAGQGPTIAASLERPAGLVECRACQGAKGSGRDGARPPPALEMTKEISAKNSCRLPGLWGWGRGDFGTKEAAGTGWAAAQRDAHSSAVAGAEGESEAGGYRKEIAVPGLGRAEGDRSCCGVRAPQKPGSAGGSGQRGCGCPHPCSLREGGQGTVEGLVAERPAVVREDGAVGTWTGA